MVLRGISLTITGALCVALNLGLTSTATATGLGDLTRYSSSTVSVAAALKPINLAGKIEGVYVQCREEGPFISASKKARAISFDAYKAAEIKKLTKKMKGKPQSAIDAAIAKLSKKLASLKSKADKGCATAIKLCLNPNTKVVAANGTVRCEGDKNSCVLSSLRCTNSMPGSCMCDAKATPAPATGTPPPSGNNPPGGGTNPNVPPSSTPAPWEGQVSLEWESMGMVAGYNVFFLSPKPTLPEFETYSTFATSISNNGTIAGGLLQSGGVLFLEQPISANSHYGLDDEHIESFRIAPIIASRTKTTLFCEVDTCPKGLVINDVNNSGKAATDKHESEYPPKVPYQLDVNNREMAPLFMNGFNGASALRISEKGEIFGIAEFSNPEGYLWNSPAGSRLNPMTVGQQFLQAHREEIKREALRNIIKYYEDPIRDCPRQLYLQSKLVGEPEVYKTSHDLQTMGVSGIVAGHINVMAVWDFTNPCMDESDTRTIIVHGVSNFNGPINGPFLFTAYTPYEYGVSESYYVVDINESRNIIGQGFGGSDELFTDIPSRVDGATSGAFWSKISLPEFQRRTATSLAMNSKGSVVGHVESTKGDGSLNAFLISNGKAIDLTKTIFPNSQWIFQSANDINDCGEIVGVAYSPGKDERPETRAVLLSPPGCR